LNKAAGKKLTKESNIPEISAFNPNCLTFVYPFGATLNVQKPAVPLLSSGSISYPLNRPVAGICQPTKKSGKILAIGSAQIFGDLILKKKKMERSANVFLQLLTTTDKIVLKRQH
jgi:intraflagellar transport protein 52